MNKAKPSEELLQTPKSNTCQLCTRKDLLKQILKYSIVLSCVVLFASKT